MPSEVQRAVPTPQLPMTLAGGRYVLGTPLGEGGTALVVRATDTTLGVERAVKLLVGGRPEARAALRRRLQAEARTMARLQHPNVLAVHDVGEEGGFDYVVTDLAPGGSVGDQLELRGWIPLPEAVDMALQVLSALGAAHAAGVVHRDVKPWNLLLDRDHRVLLADFGVALIRDEERRTRAGVAMGSFAYMPHEQRVDAAAVGPAADLYAVGATLYHLVTGQSPVDLFLHAHEPDHPRWSLLPPILRDVVRRACAERPEDRYPDAEAMAADLRAVRALVTSPPPVSAVVVRESTLPLDAAPTGPTLSPSAPARRWVPIALGAAALAGVAAWWSRPAPELPAPTPAPAAARPPPLDDPPGIEAPTPVRAPSPPAAPAAPTPAADHPLLGAWSGSRNGVKLVVELGGRPEAVVGRVTSGVGEKRVSYAVTGRVVDGVLELDEAETGGVYRLAPEGPDRLRGSWDLDGNLRTLLLRRSP